MSVTDLTPTRIALELRAILQRYEIQHDPRGHGTGAERAACLRCKAQDTVRHAIAVAEGGDITDSQ